MIKTLRIGIIGAGFCGLAAGYKLAKMGHQVTIFEQDEYPGGLAVGFKKNGWKWSLEKHYHHLFTSDDAIIDLAKEVNHQLLYKETKSATFYKGKIYNLDSPLSLIKFSPLPLLDRFKTGILILLLRIIPFTKLLEKITTSQLVVAVSGKQSWKIVWEPLMIKKFGRFSKEISASWFWARIKKRSKTLVYPESGFLSLAQKIVSEIVKNKGEIKYGQKITSIKKKENSILIQTQTDKSYEFDRVICTLPTGVFLKIVSSDTEVLPKFTRSSKGLGAVNLVLTLKQKFLPNDIYWLNVNDRNFPFLAVVEHTNFIDSANFNKNVILYVGNYLETSDRLFKMDQDQLFTKYWPFLKKINPLFEKKWVKELFVFKAPYAQPIVGKNYSKNIPPFQTQVPGLFLANIEQVFPWDRGTNYAVELGNKIADLCVKN